MTHFVTTRAGIQTCRRCSQLTLAGLAEGLIAVVDIAPIADEAGALRTGRETYDLAAGELIRRDDFRRLGQPSGPLLATHVCPPKPQGELW